MLNTIFDALMLIFTLIGIFFVCYIVFQKVLRRRANGFFALVPGFPDDERLPEKVYSAFVEANLLNFLRVNKVIVLDFGVSERLKFECENLIGCDKNVRFIEIEPNEFNLW